MKSIAKVWHKGFLKHGLTGFLLVIAQVSYANEPPLVVGSTPQLITQTEIQQGLLEMKNKMNIRIEDWGKQLDRNDFDRKNGKLVLKKSKQVEVCRIFQVVIDETYQSAQSNKHRLAPAEQKMVETRAAFISALGIKDNIIQTKLDFDCRIT